MQQSWLMNIQLLNYMAAMPFKNFEACLNTNFWKPNHPSWISDERETIFFKISRSRKVVFSKQIHKGLDKHRELCYFLIIFIFVLFNNTIFFYPPPSLSNYMGMSFKPCPTHQIHIYITSYCNKKHKNSADRVSYREKI